MFTLQNMSHILLIEDDDVLRETMKIALEGEFFRVKTAPSLKEGMRQLLSWRPALIITDYWIGLDFADSIIAVSKENINNPVPILIYSGWDGIENFSKNQKIHGFLKKPFRLRELMVALAHFMPAESLNSSNHNIERFLGAYKPKKIPKINQSPSLQMHY